MREYLTDPVALDAIVKFEMNTRLWLRISPETRAAWAARPALPVRFEESGAAEETEDILALTGLGNLLKRCIERLEIMSSESIPGCRGKYDPKDSTIQIAVMENPDDKPLVPSTLFHETGHAVETFLGGIRGGKAAFDRYAVNVIFLNAEPTSEYPEALSKISGKLGSRFLTEQFAEDFRLLLEYPDRLPQDRLELMADVFQKAFPDADLDELQSKIRRMFGNLYGTNARAMQVPVNCDTISDFAERYVRRSSEAYRDIREPDQA